MTDSKSNLVNFEMNEWEQRYQQGETPWDKGEPSPGLVDFLNENQDLPKGTAAIPGCGTGHDVRAWARAGFDAWGFDVAESAVRSSQQQTAAAGLKAQFSRADFLKDTPPQKFDWLFEHTLFCAISPTQREDYISAARRWLKPDGNYLAVYYLIPDVDGPPFGTTGREILARFNSSFELIRAWVPRSFQNRTGMEWMVWWKPRMA